MSSDQMEPGSGRKKRVRPARKIVPRGQMGPQWVIAPLILGGIIVVLGVIYLVTRSG